MCNRWELSVVLLTKPLGKQVDPKISFLWLVSVFGHSYFAECETGWLEFKGHCYHKGQTKGNWSEAKVIIRCSVTHFQM